MNKEELRGELMKLNIPFTEKDGLGILKAKLDQSKLPTKNDPELAYTIMDSENDAQVLAEIQGAVLNTYVYSFEQDGKKVVGLSKAGVDAVCRESANKKGEVYRLIENKITGKYYDIDEDDKYIKVIVTVGRYALIRDKQGKIIDEILLDTAVGVKRQAKTMNTRFGMRDNQFAFECAFSKAQRNAKASLLPYKLVAEMIEHYRAQGKEKVIQASNKIGASQLQYLHALANEMGISHEKLTELVNKEFRYQSLNEVNMTEVSRVAELIRANKPKEVKIPIELIGLFNEKNILKAKRDAMWLKAYSESNGDVNKAIELLKGQLAKEKEC